MNLRTLLVAYGLTNAILYSALLPLWEGFDEPFHFDYVQHLANGRGLPDPRTSFISAEVDSSLAIAPASRVVQQNLPQVRTYSQFFALTPGERAEVRQRLCEIRPDLRWGESQSLNYEAHHAPLAYLLLAGPERLLAATPLIGRVLVLRLICAIAGALLLYFATLSLLVELRVPDPYMSATLFCVLSCQMTWATLAHVANDWLAVPLAVFALSAGIRYWRSPALRTAALLAVLLAAGLLTNSYFLALAPTAIVLCLWRNRWRETCLVLAILLTTAGPWYVRNLVRYGEITGMQESRAGVNAATVVHSAALLDWARVLWASVRGALWTGNNTFMSFSIATTAAMAAVWLIGLALWTVRRRQASAEWVVAGYSAVFLAALAYVAVVSFVYTRQAAVNPSPWYFQVLVAPLLALAFLGYARSGAAGRMAAGALAALFGYVLFATYVVKLIPFYGGYQERTTLVALVGLYTGGLPALLANLDMIALAPAWLLLGLTGIVAGLVILQLAVLFRSLWRSGCHESAGQCTCSRR